VDFVVGVLFEWIRSDLVGAEEGGKAGKGKGREQFFLGKGGCALR